MKKLLLAMAFYLSLIPLIGAGAFAFGYMYSAGVETYYHYNPVGGDGGETITDYSEPEDAEYRI